MARPGVTPISTTLKLLLATVALAAVASCGPKPISAGKGGPYAPGVDLKKDSVDGVEVAHRLMAAGQYELALDAYTRAAGEHGLTAEVLTSLGSANLALGRLNQSEPLLRRAVDTEPLWAEAWNNLGVVLIERGKTAEAERYLRKAFALDNGESDAIRDNLRLALAKLEKTDNNEPQNTGYQLIPQGGGSYLLSQAP